MGMELPLIRHVWRLGDVKAEIKKTPGRLAAVVGLPQDRISAEADRAKVRIIKAVDRGERFTAAIGNRQRNQLGTGIVGKFQRPAAAGSEELAVGFLVDKVFVT